MGRSPKPHVEAVAEMMLHRILSHRKFFPLINSVMDLRDNSHFCGLVSSNVAVSGHIGHVQKRNIWRLKPTFNNFKILTGAFIKGINPVILTGSFCNYVTGEKLNLLEKCLSIIYSGSRVTNIQLLFSKANEELDVEFFLEKWWVLPEEMNEFVLCRYIVSCFFCAGVVLLTKRIILYSSLWWLSSSTKCWPTLSLILQSPKFLGYQRRRKKKLLDFTRSNWTLYGLVI